MPAFRPFAAGRLLSPLALIVCFSATSSICRAKPITNFNKLNGHPTIIRYEPKTDTLYRSQSVIHYVPDEPPGGRESYSGSRLRQFRFLGKPGRGGMYDAFQEYHRSVGAEEKNYKFRLR